MGKRIYSINDRIKAINKLAEIVGLTNDEKINLVNRVMTDSNMNDINDNQKKDYYSYNCIRDTPPINDYEFEGILVHKGMLRRDTYGNIYETKNSKPYLRVIKNEVYYNRDKFQYLVSEIGLVSKTLF